MILCVTLNPCLDKTLIVPPWEPGDSVRGVAVREVVGGKGNNVARALCRLGRVARPVTFLGGTVGAACERRLRVDDALDPVVIPVEACTREILTVRTQDTPRQTAFFDPDPVITAAEADSLHQRVADTMAAGTVEMLTLSGSSPCKTTDTLFNDLIALRGGSGFPSFSILTGPPSNRSGGSGRRRFSSTGVRPRPGWGEAQSRLARRTCSGSWKIGPGMESSSG